MNGPREIPNTTVCAKGTLKKALVVLFAMVLVVNLSPLGALSSYAESGSALPAEADVDSAGQPNAANGADAGLRATPAEGYRFIGWYDDQGNLLSEDAEYVPAKVDGEGAVAACSARFVVDRYYEAAHQPGIYSEESAGPAPPASEEILSDEAGPSTRSAEECSIHDEDNPLALVQSPGYWSLVDVLATIFSTAAALLLFARAMKGEWDCERERERERRKKRDREKERKYRTPLLLLVVGIAVAVASVIAVFVTQDFSYQMALFDAWSSLFFTGALVNVLLIAAEWRRSRDRDGGFGTEVASLVA